MKSIVLAIAVAGLCAGFVSAQAEQATTKDQLVGTWKVVMVTASSGDKVSYPLGEQPSGFISLTPTRFWLLFVDSTRKPPASATLTDPEAVGLMKSHVAWTGLYTTADQTPDGIKTTAHVDTASNQAISGTDRVYFTRVEGNKMTMKSPGVVIPMTGLTSVVKIELVKAD